MPWKTITACIVCVLLVFFARGLFVETQPMPDQGDTEVSGEVVQNGQSSRLAETVSEEEPKVEQAVVASRTQPVEAVSSADHLHHTGEHEGCADCEAATQPAKPETPISLAVRNLQADDCFSRVSSILADTEGVIVGHASAEGGRIDLLYAPGETDLGAIKQMLTQAGIEVDGSLVTMKLAGAIAPEQERQLKTQIERMDGVVVRKVSNESGRVELMISHPTTTQGDVEQALRESGYKVN